MSPSLTSSEGPYPANEPQAAEGQNTRRRTARLLNWLRRRPIKAAKRGLAVILWLHGVDLAQIETSTGMPVTEIETWIDRYRNRHTRGLEAARRAIVKPIQSLSAGELTAAKISAKSETVEGPGSDPLARPPSVVDPAMSPPPEEPAGITNGGGPAPNLWLELEPADPNDSFPAEVCSAETGNGGWKLVGASSRGRLHRHEAKYREDAFEVAVAGEWHIAVVADGAGSAPLARVGAHLATAAAVTKLRNDLPSGELREPAVRDSLAAAAEHARQALQAEAHLRQTTISAFATTLLIITHRVVESGHWVAVFQVGDGAIAGCAADGRVVQFGRPDQGEYAGETQFLTHLADAADILARIQIVGELSPDIELVVAMTDGVADDFHPPERELPLLIGHVRAAVQAGGETSALPLLSLLGYKKKGSFDDRTLVVLAAPRVVESLALPHARHTH